MPVQYCAAARCRKPRIRTAAPLPLLLLVLTAPQLRMHVQECPICTVTFPSMNTASCCAARVCTECFVYHQTSSDPPGQAQCPFCKTMPFAVRVRSGWL
jgi:hypothetical protein